MTDRIPDEQLDEWGLLWKPLVIHDLVDIPKHRASSVIAACISEIRSLRAKLLKTKDGEYVGNDDSVWLLTSKSRMPYRVYLEVSQLDIENNAYLLEEGYSTKEAAEKASASQ